MFSLCITDLPGPRTNLDKNTSHHSGPKHAKISVHLLSEVGEGGHSIEQRMLPNRQYCQKLPVSHTCLLWIWNKSDEGLYVCVNL